MGEEFAKLKAIIADVLSVDPEEITPETTFTDDLGADSLDLYQIVMGIEEEFGLTVDPEVAEKVTTVDEALKLIKGARGDA
jgi:acyl carrier protein